MTNEPSLTIHTPGPLRFRDWDVEVYTTTYVETGRPAIVLLAAETLHNLEQDVLPGEPIATPTVNLIDQDLAPGQTFIKSWSENEGMLEWLDRHGIVAPVGRCVSAGHALADVARILERNPA